MTQRDMKLYYAPGACTQAPHIILNETGLPYEKVRVDLETKRTEDGADYLAIAPKGAVPALELDDGELLTENAVVLQYIADQAPGWHLIPPYGTMERYRVLEWLNYIATELHKGFAPLFHPTGEPRAHAMDALAAKFDYVESQLGAGALAGRRRFRHRRRLSVRHPRLGAGLPFRFRPLARAEGVPPARRRAARGPRRAPRRRTGAMIRAPVSLLLAALFALAAPAAAQKRIALSFDDVPRAPGTFMTPQQRTDRLIAALRRAGVRAGRLLRQSGQSAAALGRRPREARSPLMSAPATSSPITATIIRGSPRSAPPPSSPISTRRPHG